jgi:hypothetical protein
MPKPKVSAKALSLLFTGLVLILSGSGCKEPAAPAAAPVAETPLDYQYFTGSDEIRVRFIGTRLYRKDDMLAMTLYFEIKNNTDKDIDLPNNFKTRLIDHKGRDVPEYYPAFAYTPVAAKKSITATAITYRPTVDNLKGTLILDFGSGSKMVKNRNVFTEDDLPTYLGGQSVYTQVDWEDGRSVGSFNYVSDVDRMNTEKIFQGDPMKPQPAE